MQIGAVLPQTEIGADLGSVRAYAQTVQDLGFEHLVSSDHVLGADPAGHPGWNRPQNHKTVVHEPFVLFGFIAGVAPKLGLLTSVVILPQRQATLDWLRRTGPQLGVSEPTEVLLAEKAWAGANVLLPLVASRDPLVQNAALRALGRLSGRGQL